MRSLNDQKLYRIIDANFNRAKEGLRVCEDICRFILNDPLLTKNFKSLRHRLTHIILLLELEDLIGARDIERDVGKKSSRSESTRKKWLDIFYANIQRVKESIRVLEEFSKLTNVKLSQNIKNIRYKLYALEKKTSAKF